MVITAQQKDLGFKIPVTLVQTQGYTLLRSRMHLCGNIINDSGVTYLHKDSWLTNEDIELIARLLAKGEILFMSLDWACGMTVNDIRDASVQGILERSDRFNKFKEIMLECERNIETVFRLAKDGSTISLLDIETEMERVHSFCNDTSELYRYSIIVDYDVDVTTVHVLNVALVCRLFGELLGYESEMVKKLSLIGLLHDLGKVYVPRDILAKPSALTPEEFEIIKQHPTNGYLAARRSSVDKDLLDGILMHHEKMDGSGYPFGIGATEITEVASIIAICDIWDAMVSNRSYRKSVCPFKVIEMFENNSFGSLNNELLSAFLQEITYLYLGYAVQLNDGRIGVVVSINQASLSKPIIKIPDGPSIDLSKNSDLFVAELL